MSSGQTFMPDFLASILVFTALLTVFLYSWNALLQDQTQFNTEDDMRLQGRYATVFLTTTPGYPENWESSSEKVVIPGFAEPDNLLQGEKLLEFRSLNYSRQKDLLQAPEFNLTLVSEGSAVDVGGREMSFGTSYSDAETVIPFERSVQVNDSGKILSAKLKYVVWR